MDGDVSPSRLLSREARGWDGNVCQGNFKYGVPAIAAPRFVSRIFNPYLETNAWERILGV